MSDHTVITPEGARPMPGMGLRKDPEDLRDRRLFRSTPNIDALPERASCAQYLPEVLDQHAVGACTGYSAATVAYMVMAKEYAEKARVGRAFLASPVFLYAQARLVGEEDIRRTGYDTGVRHAEDTGAMIRDIWKAASKLGLPPMSNLKPRFERRDLPDPNTYRFPDGSIWIKPPTKGLLADGARRKALSYYRMAGLPEILKSIADGFPVNIGFEVFRSLYGPGGPRFEVPDPDPSKDRSLGGHAVTAYEYDKPSRRVLLRNQWSQTAHEGRPDFTLSFSYLEKHSWDNWSCRDIMGVARA